jgi:hypothetical protein
VIGLRVLLWISLRVSPGVSLRIPRRIALLISGMRCIAPGIARTVTIAPLARITLIVIRDVAP